MSRTPSKYPILNGVMTYPDGREVCNQKAKAGRQEYYTRTLQMLNRQAGRCAICHNPLIFLWVQFDHQEGRGSGGGHRDDRIEIHGQWHNAALCSDCNTRKGSVRYYWQDGLYVPVNQK